MSYLLKRSSTTSLAGDLAKTSDGTISFYSNGLDENEVRAMLEAYRAGTLKSHLHSLRNHTFLGIIIDASDNSVLLINDKFGSNHLFYARRGEVLWVSDDLKRLYGELGEKPVVDPVAAYEMVDLYTICPPRTIFQGLEAVPMGSILKKV